MKKLLTQNPVKLCWGIFALLIAVHGFEAIVLRMDETFFGENFINKLFGILVIWLVLRMLQWNWAEIGFRGKGFLKNVACGLALAAGVFLAAYGAELLILTGRGDSVQLGIFTMGFSLTGAAEIHRGLGYILMCVIFNIINVIMEEGVFRGLFHRILKTDRSERFAILFQAFLFGIWHVVTPLHNLIDGDLDLGGFLGLVVALGHADADQGRALILHDGAHVGEVQVDHGRNGDQVGDGLHALAQNIIRFPKRVHEGNAAYDFQQTVVADDDQ